VNIVVLGANGQLGTEVVRVLRAVEGYTVRPLTHDEIEVADPSSVSTELERTQPDVVVNCAAFHRVDDCEDRPEEALRVNALGALNVARTCGRLDALCVQVSTDYVFGGGGGGPNAEDSLPAPVNIYGASKLAGEHFVPQACPRWLIVRVASLFGTTPPRGKGKNFVQTVLAKAQAQEPIKIVDDVRMSPTYTVDAARGLEVLIRQQTRGLVHLTNAGSCSRYECASRIVTFAGFGATVIPITAAQYRTRARRPADSSLRSVRASDEVRRCLRPWDEALKAYLVERAPVGQRR